MGPKGNNMSAISQPSKDFWKTVTRLPVEVTHKETQLGQSLIVTTPHRGKVVVDTQDDLRTMFSARRVKKFDSKVIREVKDLESEAIQYLLKEWKEDLCTK